MVKGKYDIVKLDFQFRLNLLQIDFLGFYDYEFFVLVSDWEDFINKNVLVCVQMLLFEGS